MKILIADAMSDRAVDILKEKQLEVDVRADLKKKELQAIIGGYDALVVRSATKVTRDIIEKADRLKVIGRAGTGVDNVDVEAATEKGIIVMNAPQGNALAAAEHALALLFALARKISLADRTMKEGKWEKKLLMGVQVQGKTIGVIGIGNVGMIVAEKAVALGMRVIAYDPHVPQEVAVKRGIELVSLRSLLSRSDFITVHVPLLKETKNLLNKDNLSKSKKGVFIVNAARGGIINEHDLCRAIEDGQVAGAALDVFEQEPPPPDHPLVVSEKVIATPHLGASTSEAQSKVAIDIASQIADYVTKGIIKNSVNTPPVSTEVLAHISPYLALSERLARFISRITESPLKQVEIEYAGAIAEVETTILTQGIVKSILSPYLEGINYVNARLLARNRGIKVKEIKEKEHDDFTTLLGIRIKGRKEENVAYGTLLGKTEPRLVRVNNISIDSGLVGNVVFVVAIDKPGTVAGLGGRLAEKGINIARINLSREREGGLVVCMLDIDGEVDQGILREISAVRNVIRATLIDFA
jgi:D-3-phosphoglycerate dehydrogenase